MVNKVVIEQFLSGVPRSQSVSVPLLLIWSKILHRRDAENAEVAQRATKQPQLCLLEIRNPQSEILPHRRRRLR